MTVPFSPRVVPIPERDFLDTVTRSFTQARAFIEREAASSRRAQDFQTRQEIAGLEQQSLEATLEAQEFARRQRALSDPSLVTDPNVAQPAPAAPQPQAPLPSAAFEQPDFQAEQEPPLVSPEFQLEAAAGQPAGEEIFTGRGGEPVSLAPLEVTGEPTPGAVPQPRPELPGPIPAFRGEPGVVPEALEPFRGEPGVVPEVPARAEFGPPPAPGGAPSVSGAISAELGAGEPEVQTPRAQLERVGTVGGQEFFFDPQGQERAATQDLSEAGNQIRQVLNGLAAREDAAGRTDEGEAIRAEINNIVAQVETGATNPADLLQDVIVRTQQNAATQQLRDFLTAQVGDENLPEGLNDLPLEAQVEELQFVRRRINRPVPREDTRGQLTEGQIGTQTQALMKASGVDPNTATPDVINQFRARVIQLARGVPEGEEEQDRGPSVAQRQTQVARLSARLLQTIEQLEESDETEALRSTVEAIQNEVTGKNADELLEIIRLLIERQREVDRAVSQ